MLRQFLPTVILQKASPSKPPWVPYQETLSLQRSGKNGEILNYFEGKYLLAKLYRLLWL